MKLITIQTIFAVLLARGEEEEEWYTCPKSPQAAYFHFYTPTFGKQETSVQVYETARWDNLNWNCIAAMSENYLDSFTVEAPLLRAPAGYHSARHRVSCTFYALYETLPGFMPDMVEKHMADMKEWGFDKYTSDTVRAGVRACLDKEKRQAACLQKALDDAMDKNRHPLAVAALIGSMVGHLHADFMKNDGMNAGGMMGKDGKACTKNCWRYRDTTGFTPVNMPNQLKDEKRWQPLVESDGLGFLYAQEHVTPQVGTLEALTVPPEFLERTVEDPNYDYESIDMDPVKAVADLAGDTTKKMLIEYLDAKSQILSDIGMELDLWSGYSYEQKALFLNGYTSVELDAVAVTWKEKIRHNAIRPTSRVQQAESFKGDDVMKWYDGTMVSKEDWTPYIRVMPHAEYPSGSASICWSIADYIDAYMKDVMDEESLEVTKTFKAGSSNVDKSLPKEEFSYTFKDMTEVAELCSESRLWGGMHYRPAIIAAKGLVEGFGQTAYEWTKLLQNGDELPGILEEDKPKEKPADPPAEKKDCGSSAEPRRKAKALVTKMVDGPCECMDHCKTVMKSVAWSMSKKQDGGEQATCTCLGGKFASLKRVSKESDTMIRSGFL